MDTCNGLFFNKLDLTPTLMCAYTHKTLYTKFQQIKSLNNIVIINVNLNASDSNHIRQFNKTDYMMWQRKAVVYLKCKQVWKQVNNSKSIIVPGKFKDDAEEREEQVVMALEAALAKKILCLFSVQKVHTL
jgi:hypothetical protein